MQSNQAAMFTQQYGNIQNTVNQPYGNYPGNNMMANNMANNQQVLQGGSGGMFPGQQQGFATQQRPQPDYRGMAQNPRQQYIQQQVPNVTMNANMNPMGAIGGQQAGAVPPYSRPNAQGMQPGIQGQPNQFQQQQQQQQRMRQQMMAMQQQHQGGPQGQQPSPNLVSHLRQMPYHQQPPPYNM
ncbi:hypothetical protein HHI36_006433 [Cryptolaemus montrouzieri]|uniref:Uncharacterized protein n=1 Tax=Cryptolaemus montrouzieri TaxID=559131 RepID=A0ABD2NXX8_9CUCU